MAWTTPRTWVAGETISAAQLNANVRDNTNALYREISYTERTTDVSITATTEAGATTILTAAAFTANGTDAYEISCFGSRLQLPGAGLTTTLWLYLDGASVGQIGYYHGNAGDAVVTVSRRLVPASGSRTFSLRGSNSTGATSTFYAGTGGSGLFVPAFIRITKAT